MSNIHTPSTIENAPTQSQPLLNAVKQQLGVVPNLFRIMSNSPQTLEGYLGLNGAIGKGTLSAQTRERIALAVAQLNGCDYCLAAHTYLGTNLAKLSNEEINTNRLGTSKDEKAAIAVEFAALVVKQRGKVSKHEVAKVISAGYSEAQVLEIIANVIINTFSNYINEVLQTEIDFPEVDEVKAA